MLDMAPRPHPRRCWLVLCAMLPAVVWAADAANTAPVPSVPEPHVQRSVINDQSARIEELRVRGQTQRITVQPKGDLGGKAPPYEVVPTNANKEALSGQRVWQVLSF